MVKLNKIYTRTGDSGQTGLGDGSRRDKHDLRVEAYGAVDEANAAIAIAAAWSKDHLHDLLCLVQNDLFDLGADLCTPSDGQRKQGALRIAPVQVTELENAIDQLNSELDPLKSFVLPGGTKLAALLHGARTVVRRAERRVTHLATNESVSPDAIKYLNRLSDLLFVIARYDNKHSGHGDVLWQPAQGQQGQQARDEHQ